VSDHDHDHGSADDDGDGSGGGDAGHGADDRPVVLAVDDEPRVVQAFELWLGDDYRVLTATGGEQALELMGPAVDVVLLDRHMPGLSGDEVLERIREAEYDCAVAMVTAVDPAFDIVEMPFDHYVPKPVDGAELGRVVDRLLELREYDGQLNELYTTTQKIATLEAEQSRAALADSGAYDDLLERRDRLQAALDDRMASMSAAEVEELFQLLDAG
jgi:DNA-binding response OmpR family regulator